MHTLDIVPGAIRIGRQAGKMMNKRLVIIALLFVSVSLFSQEKLVFSRTEGDWAGQTLTMRVLRYAYRKLGFEIGFVAYPMERSVVSANTGVTDGVVSRTEGTDAIYSDLVRVKVPVSYLEQVVFVTDADFKIEGWESLRPYRITIMRGNKLAERNTMGMMVEFVSSPDLGFRKLLSGGADVMLEARDLIPLLNDPEFRKIRILKPPLERIPMYHYVNRKHAAIVPYLEAILAEMHESGLFDEFSEDVMREYGLE